jgi:PilZ domain
MTGWQPPRIQTSPSISPPISANERVTETAEERRRVSRQDADWVGTWRLADHPDATSFECKVLDISKLGAGIEIDQSRQVDLIGQKITVTAQPLAGGSVSVRFVGMVRHVHRKVENTEFRGGAQGRISRLGIEFVSLSNEEIATLDAIGRFLSGA